MNWMCWMSLRLTVARSWTDDLIKLTDCYRRAAPSAPTAGRAADALDANQRTKMEARVYAPCVSFRCRDDDVVEVENDRSEIDFRVTTRIRNPHEIASLPTVTAYSRANFALKAQPANASWKKIKAKLAKFRNQVGCVWSRVIIVKAAVKSCNFNSGLLRHRGTIDARNVTKYNISVLTRRLLSHPNSNLIRQLNNAAKILPFKLFLDL
ncbi:hypothetical protein EVAR_23699_1 [Eumeta japonica]|uniref:Uncharacterized protein n=1 Tax=Eumeta variegata TaxID=151549 RepID=A0A4C1VH32_EUMVA|nr:hypothetical protein EVAR_23699_1 [Eumeta japonica]